MKLEKCCSVSISFAQKKCIFIFLCIHQSSEEYLTDCNALLCSEDLSEHFKKNAWFKTTVKSSRVLKECINPEAAQYLTLLYNYQFVCQSFEWNCDWTAFRHSGSLSVWYVYLKKLPASRLYMTSWWMPLKLNAKCQRCLRITKSLLPTALGFQFVAF